MFFCKKSSLFEAIHCSSVFDVDISIGGNEFGQFVLVNDFLGNIAEVHAYVLKSIKGGVQIHVGYVNANVTSVLGGESLVPVYFNGFKVGSFGADGARVVSDKFSTSSESGSVRFVFFRMDG